VTSNKKSQGAAIFVGDRHQSATPLADKLYQENVNAENIIASEHRKFLAS
jgi:hypothetical protein